MKLHHLTIDRYNLLKDFKIDFSKQISILIGLNGSGKSSLLEALALIFSDAILNQPSKFGFRLVYDLRVDELRSQTTTTGEFRTDYITVELSAPGRDEKISYKALVGNLELQTKEEVEDRYGSLHKIFPSNIVIYYSGLSETMKDICKPHDLEFSRQYREEQIHSYRPFFYFEPVLFGILLLSLLSYEYGDIPPFLKNTIKIDYLQSARIRLRKPAWARRVKANNWWGARGEIKEFLDFLASQGRPLVIDEAQKDQAAVGNVIIESVEDEFINISIIGQSMLFRIREQFSEEKKLFDILNALYIDGFLDDIEFSFHNKDGQFFENLSEGEKQAIIIKGLTELVVGENTLFLFDEPDTYLHPSWQRNFIEGIMVFTKVEINPFAQFVITTHSPSLLSNAEPEVSEVWIMEEGKLVRFTPKYYGKEISTILYELMGVKGRIPKIAQQFSDLFNFIEDEELTKAKEAYLSLANLLGEDESAMVRAKIQLNYLEEEKDEADK